MRERAREKEREKERERKGKREQKEERNKKKERKDRVGLMFISLSIFLLLFSSQNVSLQIIFILRKKF